ncbi:hypothetical protein ACOMHN_037526 [Nucella lapillus]
MTHPVSALGVLLTLMVTSQVTQSKCPWEESGLTLWSDESTWVTDGIPAEGKPASISTGGDQVRHVGAAGRVSDASAVGAKLVWGHTEGLVLTTGHIQVEGEFLVGKDTRRCRMDKKATIILTGNDVYLLQNTSYKEANSGLHVIVWNSEGSVFDFNVFDTDRLDYFSTYLSEIDAGKIVGIAVRKTIGDTTDSYLNWDSVYVAMETLGAKQIRSVTSEDSYAFVVVKGEALLATATEEGNRKEDPYVSYIDWSKNLQFSVRSVLDKRAAKPEGIDFKIVNTDLTHPIIKLKDDVSSWKVGSYPYISTCYVLCAGSYPLHFHLLGDGSGLWFRNNSVLRSFQRCFVIQGTDNAEVSENVCYDHLGHGLFIEDSAEQNNLIKGNLILGTQHGTTLFSDRKRDWCDPYPVLFCHAVASYWITHPNNVFEDNVAAGSDNSGFWFAFADDPLGPSKAIQDSKPDGIKHKETRYTPIKQFHNNVAHSNERFGVILEGRISNGEEFRGDQAPENAFLMESSNSLDPREPNNENGDQRLSLLEQTTVYHNKENNMYARGGNVFAVRSSYWSASNCGETLTALLTDNAVSSWKIAGEGQNAVVVLRLKPATKVSTNMADSVLNQNTQDHCQYYRTKVPSQILRDQKRARQHQLQRSSDQPDSSQHDSTSGFDELFACDTVRKDTSAQDLAEQHAIPARREHSDAPAANLVPNVLLCSPFDYTGEAERGILTTGHPKFSI